MCRRWFGSASAAEISSRVNCPVRIGSSPLMPCAASPSAIAFTSSGCRLHSCAIWSNDSDVFSTSHTAVALGIKGAVAIDNSPLSSARPAGRSHSTSSKMTGKRQEYRRGAAPAQPAAIVPRGRGGFTNRPVKSGKTAPMGHQSGEPSMAGTLDGKVAIVTGAGRGLGRVMALGLLEAGARVVAVDLDGPPLDEIQEAAEDRGAGNRFNGVVADVTWNDSGPKIVRVTAERFGHVDILVNNAGTNIGLLRREG